MAAKPKIGLLFFTSGWFREVGLQSSSSGITGEVERIAGEIKQKLTSLLEPVYCGVIFSGEDSAAAASKVRSEGVDGVIVAPLMWAEDQLVRAALRVLPDLPIILCLFLPYDALPDFVGYQEMLKGSGLVGALQWSGFLKREGYEYKTVSGYYRDASVYDSIREHCLALSVRKNLKSAKCGVLPFRCDVMSTTYVDEFKIRDLYGVELKYLELSRFKREAAACEEDEIIRFESRLRDSGYEIEIDLRNLHEGIRYAIAMEKIIREERINIFVMNDIIDEMHSCFGMRPCLPNPEIAGSDAVVNMEADVAAGVAMYALQLFTGDVPFYTETYTADLKNNALLMGHPGYHNVSNFDESYPVRIVSDIEYVNTDIFTGASAYFKYKPGPVTAVNCVYNGDKLRWSVFEGISLEGPPKMEGTCHLFCQTDKPVIEILDSTIQIGVSQHWIVVPGRIMARLKRLCSWLNIDFVAV
jgi:L-fucose isomerase-like protein